MSRRIRRKPCHGCGKVSYRDLPAAEFGARRLIADLIQRGYRVEPMYAYRCLRTREGYYHLTRMAQASGQFPAAHPSIPLAAAPPPGYVPPVVRVTAEQFERLVDGQGRA